MYQTADELLTGYERGRVSRRELLAVIAGLGVSGGVASAQQAPPASAAASRRVNHINLKVSNMERSLAFYEKVFGPGHRKAATYTAIDLGAGSSVPWLSLQVDANVKQEGRLQYAPIWHQSLYTKPGTWEHICIEVDNFADTIAALKTTGAEMSQTGDIVWTHDPDGALLQIQNGKPTRPRG